MTISIADILARRNAHEPPEMAALKGYVYDRYKIIPKVQQQAHGFVLSVPSAALAGTLRLESLQIIAGCGLEKQRLIIRIG